GRSIAQRREHLGAFSHRRSKVLRLRMSIDEFQFERALSADTLCQGAEDVRMIAAHLALVGESSESTGTWQHAKERHFRQAHGRRAIVDEPDLIAGERKLVAAPRRGAVARGEKLETGVSTCVLYAI